MLISQLLLIDKLIEGGNIEEGILYAGNYSIECAGGKGGDGKIIELFSRTETKGGAGAKGWINIKVDYHIDWRAVAGKQGKKGSEAEGGFPDGGKSGEDESDWTDFNDDYAGSGGGSSSFYINNVPALVCGAGSGGYYKTDGAPAGGHEYNYVNNEENKFKQIEDHSKSTNSMKGGDGSADNIPYAGGGGGYRGGIGGNGKSKYAASGESYINKLLVYDYKIYDGTQNPNNGDGFVRISEIFTCPHNCASCDSAETCSFCNSSAPYLHENKCVNQCPESHFADTFKVCTSCDPDCKTCEARGKCTACKNKMKVLNKNGKCVYRQTQSFENLLALRSKYVKMGASY